MIVEKIGIDPIISDNQEEYFQVLSGTIEGIDDLASIQITKLIEGYGFRIVPSSQIYNDLIINQILELNNKLGIRLDLGKSIRTSTVINFKINLDNK